MKRLQKDQRGFTLLELLVAIPIAALVVTAASGAIFQILNSTRANNYMVAYRQVQEAGHRVNRDGIQAQEITVSAAPGFPFTFEWTDWDSEDKYRIAYTLEDMPNSDLKYLQRRETIHDKDGNLKKDEFTGPVPQYIYLDTDSAKPTNCLWDSDEKVLTFTVKAQVGEQTATRTYKIKPRPLS